MKGLSTMANYRQSFRTLKQASSLEHWCRQTYGVADLEELRLSMIEAYLMQRWAEGISCRRLATELKGVRRLDQRRRRACRTTESIVPPPERIAEIIARRRPGHTR
jgi:hypothetical protein